MDQHPSYESYSYPTEFQGGVGGGGDTDFSARWTASLSPTPLAAAGGSAGAVGSTGLTRRSAQHAANNNNINFAVAAAANNNASPTGQGPVTISINAPSHNSTQFPGSYGYFHHHGNSIDVSSGYNSDVGSSVSNPRYSVSGYPTGGASGAGAATSSRAPDVVVGSGSAQESFNPPDVSPVRPPPAPRFGGARLASAVPSVNGPPSPSMGAQPYNSIDGSNNAGGSGSIFRTGGSDGGAGSAANSTRSSGSARPPVAPPTFLSSRPFIQMLPPTSASPSTGSHPHTSSQQQQPYMVSMPSSTQSTEQHSGNDPLGGSAPPQPHVISPSATGPRMPAMASNDYAHGYGGGAGGGASSHSSGGFFGRMLAQVIPTFDECNTAGGSGGGTTPRERPVHQLRFGNPEDDLPLLEELGIFPRHILDKARAVLNPFKAMNTDAAKDTDLAGPILFAFSLALLLSLRGKIQFSAIYGLFVLGIGFFKVLLSLMQPKIGGAPLQFVVSTVGYGLLPTVLLAVVRTTCSWLLTRRSFLPLTLLMVVWSAWCGSVLVAKGLGMDEQRYLVLYPMLLFYAAFDALTVF